MAQTSALTPSDYIKKTIGNILFTYYTYLKYYHLKPRDLDDLVDGLLYMEAQQYQEEQSFKQHMARLENEAKRRRA